MALVDIGVWGTVLEGRLQPAPATPGGDTDETDARLIIDDPERVLEASLRHARSKVHHRDH